VEEETPRGRRSTSGGLEQGDTKTGEEGDMKTSKQGENGIVGGSVPVHVRSAREGIIVARMGGEPFGSVDIFEVLDLFSLSLNL
jgi:hypothetical protein